MTELNETDLSCVTYLISYQSLHSEALVAYLQPAVQLKRAEHTVFASQVGAFILKHIFYTEIQQPATVCIYTLNPTSQPVWTSDLSTLWASVAPVINVHLNGLFQPNTLHLMPLYEHMVFQLFRHMFPTSLIM